MPRTETRYTMNLCYTTYNLPPKYLFTTHVVITPSKVKPLITLLLNLYQPVHHLSYQSIRQFLPEHQDIANLRLPIERSHRYAMLPSPYERAHTFTISLRQNKAYLIFRRARISNIHHKKRKSVLTANANIQNTCVSSMFSFKII